MGQINVYTKNVTNITIYVTYQLSPSTLGSLGTDSTSSVRSDFKQSSLTQVSLSDYHVKKLSPPNTHAYWNQASIYGCKDLSLAS